MDRDKGLLHILDKPKTSQEQAHLHLTRTQPFRPRDEYGKKLHGDRRITDHSIEDFLKSKDGHYDRTKSAEQNAKRFHSNLSVNLRDFYRDYPSLKDSSLRSWYPDRRNAWTNAIYDALLDFHGVLHNLHGLSRTCKIYIPKVWVSGVYIPRSVGPPTLRRVQRVCTAASYFLLTRCAGNAYTENILKCG